MWPRLPRETLRIVNFSEFGVHVGGVYLQSESEQVLAVGLIRLFLTQS